LKVNEAMTKDPGTLPSKSTTFDAIQNSSMVCFGYILVADRGKLKGIVTERDILYRVVVKEMDPKKTRLKDVMSKPVIYIEENAELLEASELMKKNGIRRLAVVDKNGKLVGVITSEDIARSLRRSAEELAVAYHIMSRSAPSGQ
jgi:CBS domain-containing protein